MTPEMKLAIEALRKVCLERLQPLDKSVHSKALVTAQPSVVLAILDATTSTHPVIAILKKGCQAHIDGVPPDLHPDVHLLAVDLLIAFEGLAA